MKPSEIREKTVEELKKLTGTLEEEVFRLRFKHKTGGLKQSSNIKKTRRDLARVKTELSDRKRAELVR